jgi:hypothetical protein
MSSLITTCACARLSEMRHEVTQAKMQAKRMPMLLIKVATQFFNALL